MTAAFAAHTEAKQLTLSVRMGSSSRNQEVLAVNCSSMSVITKRGETLTTWMIGGSEGLSPDEAALAIATRAKQDLDARRSRAGSPVQAAQYRLDLFDQDGEPLMDKGVTWKASRTDDPGDPTLTADDASNPLELAFAHSKILVAQMSQMHEQCMKTTQTMVDCVVGAMGHQGRMFNDTIESLRNATDHEVAAAGRHAEAESRAAVLEIEAQAQANAGSEEEKHWGDTLVGAQVSEMLPDLVTGLMGLLNEAFAGKKVP